MNKPKPIQKVLPFVMRVTMIQIIVMSFSLSIAYGTESNAQEILNRKITLKVEDEQFYQVLEIIGKRAKIKFAYSPELVKKDKKVSLDAWDSRLEDVLNDLLSPDITFKVIGKQIVLLPVKQQSLHELNSVENEMKELSFALTVSGKITDENGENLPGASVLEKGTTNGTTADADGLFSLTVESQNSILVFSFIGYTTQEVPVGSQTEFNIQLTSDVSTLNEVVVVGYGTQKKVNLTGSVASVDSKVIESRPLTNLGQGLQGMIPNLNVTVGNGRPGTGAGFNIRGITSINGGGPLVLVDGVQMDPNQINPNDVASVTVLKDAAAAAIYGVRAAYGVVLITTKKGKKNTPLQINYSFDYTITRPTRLPKTINSVDYIKAFREANETGAITGGETADDTYTELDLQKAQEYLANPIPENSVYVNPANPRYYRYVGNTDWAKALYPGHAPQMQHNLSINGGDEKTTYNASLGYFNQEGILKAANQDFSRINTSLQLSSDIKPWMNLNFKMMLNRTDDDSPSGFTFGSIERLSSDLRPTMPIYHPDGNFSGQGNFTNMFALFKNNGRNLTTANDLWLTGGFEINPIKNFKVIGNYTWNSYTKNGTENRKAFNEYGANGVFLGVYPWTATPRVYESNNNDAYQALNAYAQYENTFKARHYVKAMVGYNQEFKRIKSFNANVRNLINQNIPSLNLNSDPKPNVGAFVDEWAVSGTFFRLNYAFDDRYLFEVNGRYDGTSRFARGSRYTFQPSVSAGWRISEESFFESLKGSGLISELKLRGSYGTLGNQQLDNNNPPNSYRYIPTMPVSTASYIFGTQQQASVFSPPLVSSDFTWEKVTTTNIGVDFGLFNHKLTGSFDYYTRDTKDMVVPGTPVPSVLGTGIPSQNAADLRTKGFEFSLGWNDEINDDISYSLMVALSDYSATITKYSNPSGLLSTHYEGKSFDEIWGFETAGFYQSDAEAAEMDNTAIWGGTWLAGDIRYADLDNNGKIDRGNQTLANPGDLKIIGNSTPRYQYSLNGSVQYKNFDFTLFFQGVGKRDIALGGNYFWGFGGQWDVPTEAHVGQYWTPENPNAYFPRLRFGGGGNFQNQTKYLQSAAYLRMKQITIGYNLPKSLLSKVKIERVRLYATGQNLFEFTKLHENYDPEQFNRSDYPINRAYSFGIQVGL